MHDERLTPCEADLARLGYGPPRQPTPAPARVVSVVVVYDSGASISYPVTPPKRVVGPVRRVTLISGRAYVEGD